MFIVQYSDRQSEREEQFIIVTHKQNRQLTAPENFIKVNKTWNKPVPLTTVTRSLQECNLFGPVVVRKS